MPRKLEKMVAVAVAGLIEETGHALTVQDFDDVWAINEIARKIAKPDIDDTLDILAMPLTVRGLTLYPLSLGAAKWLDDVAAVWFSDNPLLWNLCVAYTASRTCLPEDLWAIATRREARKAICRWWRHLDCSYQELAVALDKLLGLEERSEQDETREREAADYGPVVALLCREYGQSPQYWMWDAAIDEVATMLQQHESRVVAEEEAVMQERARAAGKNTRVSITTQRFRDQNKAFRLAVNELRDKWQQK